MEKKFIEIRPDSWFFGSCFFFLSAFVSLHRVNAINSIIPLPLNYVCPLFSHILISSRSVNIRSISNLWFSRITKKKKKKYQGHFFSSPSDSISGAEKIAFFHSVRLHFSFFFYVHVVNYLSGPLIASELSGHASEIPKKKFTDARRWAKIDKILQ